VILNTFCEGKNTELLKGLQRLTW